MISLEIFGIILSLMAVCSSSNLRNDREGKHTINTLSSVNQLGSPEANIPINTQKAYQNWLFDGVNRLPNNLQQINNNRDVRKDFEPLNENKNFNIKPIEALHNRELNSRIGNRFDSGQVRDMVIDESFNNNPLLRSSHLSRVETKPVNINQPEIPFLNQFNQGPESLKTKQESQLERGIVRKQDLDLLEERPLRNQEAINKFQESPHKKEIIPNDTKFNNIGLPKSEQIFPAINNQFEQVAATMPTHQNYENQEILRNPYIQNILHNYKPKKGYLVIYPNGTVEHMDSIEVLAQNYPNHILVNYSKYKNSLLSNDEQISKTYTNSKVDTVVPNKMDDHKTMPTTMTTILSMDSNKPTKTEKQEITSESSLLTTSSTQESADKYEHQTTESIDHLDTKKNEAPVVTSESTSNINSDTEISLDDKQLTTPIQEVTIENTQNGSINKDDISTINSTDKEDDQELNIKPDSGETETRSNSEKDSAKLNGTPNSELTNKGKYESSLFYETTINLEEDDEAKIGRTTQTNIESSKTSTEVNEPKQCKEEDTETDPIIDKWRQITTQGQVLDSLFLLNAPITIVKILDAEGISHECVQIGEPTSPLSYVICSVVT